MALTLFDLDNTLLSGDSDHAWMEFLGSRGIVDTEHFSHLNDRFYAEYQAGTLDIQAFLNFQLAPLAAHPRAHLDAWHREYLQERVLPMISERARALVEEHRQRGDTLVIITATNRFVTAPIAEELGIAHLLATEPEETASGDFTGRSVGIPCFQAGKVQRLRDWLRTQELDWENTLRNSTFYSDSHNDLPLLDTVTHPVAVDPDPRLRAIAEARGWPILSLHPARVE
ncbi:HAD family phosphatase [Acidithiobacillus sp.]|jgi:HAD superfamily hydrolase (TIGR01490 family)|uniref:histidinol-phosphatase n=1 Tax=Acidithiobacillus sp. TaxID=1872118 RepID=UPI0025BC037A|nr:HAD family hydrolase [Acidithiobacillus sp.]MCK9187700.1 HAD-IB family hydrolase [Acidithiobacillus sp.]MCK9358590.1 HAD-IB family hydrolase [Acidithiobacillus sp.]